MEAKALFHTLGCRGCHKVRGVGGDDGPNLTAEGNKDPGQLNFAQIGGERTLANWLKQHFRAPASVVQGSNMPELGLTEQQIDQLTFYMLSLRGRNLQEALWPKDRIRAERFGMREFATDGATLYGPIAPPVMALKAKACAIPGRLRFPQSAILTFYASFPTISCASRSSGAGLEDGCPLGESWTADSVTKKLSASRTTCAIWAASPSREIPNRAAGFKGVQQTGNVVRCRVRAVSRRAR